MSGAYLQFLLLMAYLIIGMISVTFPVFAICVVFLPQEYREYEEKQRIEEDRLREEIDELNDALSGERRDKKRDELKMAIKKSEDELKRMQEQVTPLTAKGAVVLPVILLMIALVVTCIGIFSYYAESASSVEFFFVGSIVFTGVAFLQIFKTVYRVETASLRRTRTVNFDVIYDSGEKVRSVKIHEQTELVIGVIAREDYLENATIMVHLPPEIDILSSHFKQPQHSLYPNCGTVSHFFPFMPADIFQKILLKISPKETGQYKLFVVVTARGIAKFTVDLLLNVE